MSRTFFALANRDSTTTTYQTPDVEHEENGWLRTQLAYVKLWRARHLANGLPRPRERYLPAFNSEAEASPSMVQRDFGRIIDTIESNTLSPKPRGKSPGRAKTEKRRKSLHKCHCTQRFSVWNNTIWTCPDAPILWGRFPRCRAG